MLKKFGASERRIQAFFSFCRVVVRIVPVMKHPSNSSVLQNCIKFNDAGSTVSFRAWIRLKRLVTANVTLTDESINNNHPVRRVCSYWINYNQMTRLDHRRECTIQEPLNFSTYPSVDRIDDEVSIWNLKTLSNDRNEMKRVAILGEKKKEINGGMRTKPRGRWWWW